MMGVRYAKYQRYSTLGLYSRRIDEANRLVYDIYENVQKGIGDIMVGH